MPNPIDIPAAVRQRLAALTQPRPMRRGTVSERYLMCNKAGCPCATRADARHGPYYSVVRVVQGKTRSRHVPVEHAGLLRAQVEAGQRFRKEIEAYWQACEQWADSQLHAAQAASDAEAAKKGGSKRPSTWKSSARSKR